MITPLRTVFPAVLPNVIPAKSGIHATRVFPAKAGNHAASHEQWTPAFAGETALSDGKTGGSGTLDAIGIDGYVHRNALAAPLTQVQIGEFFILGVTTNVIPDAPPVVIPAMAEIQSARVFPAKAGNHAASQEQWSPAYAGETDSGAGVKG